MNQNQKQLKKDYQQAPRPMGVFLIRNNLSDKVFVGTSLDLPGIINRHKFQLTAGVHQNKALQADWNELGAENFAFEIVDELTPRPRETVDYRAELEALEDLWLERLRPFNERGYNQPKLSREEKLERMAAQRRNEF